MATKKQRKAVTEALGHEIDDEEIEVAVDEHESVDTKELKKELKLKEIQLNALGGRDVELADEIDSIRIALAVRGVEV